MADPSSKTPSNGKDGDSGNVENGGDTPPPDGGIGNVSPLEGTIAVNDEVPVESLVLAYQAMDKLSSEICARVAKKVPASKRVLIHNLPT